MPDAQKDVTNMDSFQTNKDQFLGKIIAEAASLIAKGAHLNFKREAEAVAKPAAVLMPHDANLEQL